MLGATPVRGLVLATGHFRNGILLAPITAEAIAELVATGRSAIDLAPFSVTRFAALDLSTDPLPPGPLARAGDPSSLVRERAGGVERSTLASSSATSAVVTVPAPKRSAIASSARFSACAAVGRRREQAELRRVRRRPGSAPTRPSGASGRAGSRASSAAAVAVEHLAVVGRLVERRAAGDQREVGALQLELHGARAQPGARAAGAPRAAPGRERAARSASAPARSSSKVSSAPMLLASRSGMTGRGSIAFACSHSARPDGPSRRSSSSGSRARDVADGLEAHASPARARSSGPRPTGATTGSGARNAAPPSGGTSQLAVRLGQVGGDLGDQLDARDAGRRGQPDLVGDARAQPPGDLGGRAEQLPRRGHVQERLVERQRLDQRRHRAAGCRTRARWRRRRRRGAGGTTTASGARRSARAIGIALRTPNGRTSYEAASTTPRRACAADDDRAAAQGGVVALLDGRVERVHVQVEDRARRAPVRIATRLRLRPCSPP